MDIEETLITYIIDIYEQYCYYAKEMSEQDFDQTFYDSEGNEIHDREYLIMNYQDIINDETLDALYTILVDKNNDININLKRIISLLAGTFFIYNYQDGNNSLINYLKKTPLEEIEQLFLENYHFGIAMIKSYFDSLTKTDKYTQNLEKIKENKDDKYLNLFINNAILTNYITLNDLLRNIITDLYNLYISQGYSDIEALNATWQYFVSNFDPIGTLDKMGFDCNSKDNYKKYLLNLIIADLYEDATNNPIIQSDNEKDRIANIIPIISATFGILVIPTDEELRNRMLKHFILLQDEKEKRKNNREKTIKDNRTYILKKVNPLYKIDELSLNN